MSDGDGNVSVQRPYDEATHWIDDWGRGELMV
jgi:hypothetical protein